LAKKSTSFIGKIFSSTVFLLNIAAVLWLLLCFSASIVSPEKVKYLALFSLTTPFAIVINFFFAFLWLFSSHKARMLLSVIVLVVCWQMIPAIFGFHYFSSNDWTKGKYRFKLMSWNVHAMGTFNTPYEKEYAKGIVDFIKKENPDVLCLPEFAVNAEPEKRIYPDTIIANGKYKAYHFNMDNGFGPKIWIGTAVFSRYPVLNYEAHELSPYIYLVTCDVSIHGEIVRVGVVHLQSFRLSDEDKALIEEVKQEKNTESLNKSRPFLWKFNAAYAERAQEVEKATAILKKSPYPVIVCGDFNDLPFSYTYRAFKGDLHDAFADKGRGLGRTYNQIIPTLRIDHIFYSPEALKLTAFKTAYSPLSDHSPIVANFEIKSKASE
jgi:endonuclease/exonuclease/phosphatase family metal-dependent hydrolase